MPWITFTITAANQADLTALVWTPSSVTDGNTPIVPIQTSLGPEAFRAAS